MMCAERQPSTPTPTPSPTPIPSPQRGRGGVSRPTLQSVSEVRTVRLPPPFVGEGWGGGAFARSDDERAA